MNAETLEALKASIEKWKRNAKAKGPDAYTTGALSCPLCAIFNPPNRDFEKACNGCPVKRRTRRPFCGGTPYHDAANAWREWRVGEDAGRSARRAARAEVSFLESLLPGAGGTGG